MMSGFALHDHCCYNWLCQEATHFNSVYCTQYQVFTHHIRRKLCKLFLLTHRHMSHLTNVLLIAYWSSVCVCMYICMYVCMYAYIRTSLHGKHALNTQHTHRSMICCHTHYATGMFMFYSDFGQDHKCSLRMTCNRLSKHVGAIRVF